MSNVVQWENRTKTIKQLITELQSFKNQDLLVMVTNDEGKTFNSVKLVSKGFQDVGEEVEKVYCTLHV